MKHLTALWTAVLFGSATTAYGQTAGNIHRATLGESGQRTVEVSTEQLRGILADMSAVVLDARPLREYAISHIPGTKNVAAKPGVSMSAYVSDVAEVGRLLEGKKQTPLVLYCNGPYCGKSKRLAEELLAAGYTNVRRYQLGIPVWRALGGVQTTGNADENDVFGRNNSIAAVQTFIFSAALIKGFTTFRPTRPRRSAAS